jgi:hypothetical protein
MISIKVGNLGKMGEGTENRYREGYTITGGRNPANNQNSFQNY